VAYGPERAANSGVTPPGIKRDLVAESTVLLARARRAIAISRALLGASTEVLAAYPTRKHSVPQPKGFADLTAWNARKR
jgi:hypothetical protein